MLVGDPSCFGSVVPDVVASFSLDDVEARAVCGGVACAGGNFTSSSVTRALTSSRKTPIIIIRTLRTFFQRVPTTLGPLFLRPRLRQDFLIFDNCSHFNPNVLEYVKLFL